MLAKVRWIRGDSDGHRTTTPNTDSPVVIDGTGRKTLSFRPRPVGLTLRVSLDPVQGKSREGAQVRAEFESMKKK